MRVLLFPGQGSQVVGMAQDLIETSGAASQLLERADEILGVPLTKLMFSGPAAELQETRNAQPAILVHSLAVWEAVAPDWEPDALAAAGHSLGEYTAYVVAGALRFEDALRLVRRRGELMFEAGRANPGTMTAILGSDFETVAEVCEATPGLVVPANLNSPAQVVISGERDAVKQAGEHLKERGARRVVELNVSGAFHSPLMESAAAGLRQALQNVPVNRARFPVIANATAEPVVEPDQIRQSLVQQLLSPVLWEPTVRQLAALQPAEVLEIGPGQVLKGLLRSTDRSLSCRTLGTAEEVQAFRTDQ